MNELTHEFNSIHKVFILKTNVEKEDLYDEITLKLEHAAAMAKAMMYAEMTEMFGVPQQAYFGLLEDMILDSRKLIGIYREKTQSGAA